MVEALHAGLQAGGFVLVRLGALALIVTTATVLGGGLLHAPSLRRVTFDDAIERALVATVLGLGVLGQGLFLVGLVGGLVQPVLWISIALIHLLNHRQWRDLRRALLQLAIPSAERAGTLAVRTFAGTAFVGIAFVGIAFVALTPTLLLALAPPSTFDETLYHLPYADAFAKAGAVVPVPAARYPVFPQLWEMLYTLSVLLVDDVTARLVHFSTVPLIGGLMFVWGRRLGSPANGMLALAAWWGTPLVLWIGAAAYVDLGLTLFVTAAGYAWHRCRQQKDRQQKGRLDGERGWLMLAGLFVGFAASVKYLGLFFAAALVIGVVGDWRRVRRVRWTAAVTAFALAGLVAAPWYLRIHHHTGNPVYPFYAQVFDAQTAETNAGDAATTALRPGVEGPRTGHARLTSAPGRMVEGFRFLVMIPWRMIVNSAVFGFQAPLHPWLLFLTPLCVALALTLPPCRPLLLLTAAYCAFWLTLARDLRFLLPIVPMLYLALTAGLWRGVRPIARRLGWRSGGVVLAMTAALLIAPGFVYSNFKLNERGLPPTTAVERDRYLDRWVTGHALVADLNRRHGDDYVLYALGGEHLQYFVAGRLVGDQFGPAPFRRVLARIDDPSALDTELDRFDVTHFMARPTPKRRKMVRETPHFLRYFERLGSDGTFTLYRRTTGSRGRSEEVGAVPSPVPTWRGERRQASCCRGTIHDPARRPLQEIPCTFS